VTSKRKPEDEQPGFETSAELRRDDSESPFPPPALERARDVRLPRLIWTGWLGWVLTVLVFVALGLVIYFLVTSL
jgi:nitrate reductase NapE component